MKRGRKTLCMSSLPDTCKERPGRIWQSSKRGVSRAAARAHSLARTSPYSQLRNCDHPPHLTALFLVQQNGPLHIIGSQVCANNRTIYNLDYLQRKTTTMIYLWSTLSTNIPPTEPSNSLAARGTGLALSFKTSAFLSRS